MAENDNTVKRYKKEIDATKEFAISKFAKDVLDVKDNLERSNEFLMKVNVQEEKDIETLRSHFDHIKQGMMMTSTSMDATLRRYGVLPYNPKGQKFDPNTQEAVFTIPDHPQENNTVAEVMQTGWKIGERILRAAKVGIVKKPAK